MYKADTVYLCNGKFSLIELGREDLDFSIAILKTRLLNHTDIVVQVEKMTGLFVATLNVDEVLIKDLAQ